MIQTAIILAGGFGTRLQSVVSDLPKPMAPINSEPFLNYQMRYLKHYGIKNVLLSVGHLNHKISDYYKTGFEGLNINYVVEKQAMGTGGGIRMALEACSDSEVLALNGDSLFDIDLNLFYTQHQQKKSEISLALRRVNDAGRYGTIVTDSENRIISFKEKNNLAAPGIINAGIYLLSRQTFISHTNGQSNFSIEKDFFEKQLTELTISGFEFEGYFIDIGLPEDYQKAQHDFKAFKYR